MKRDEVIRALEHEIGRADYADLDWIDCVKVAPLRDALALLRGTMVHMLTAEEFDAQEEPYDKE